MLYKLVNEYGSDYRPYMGMGRFVNHLPMAQLALYKMTGKLDRVSNYSEFFVDHSSIDPIRSTYQKTNKLDTCVGERALYESCLDLVSQEIASQGVDQLVKHVLTTYPLGLSSGLFHVLIRLGYAVEGYQMEPESKDEIARSLAYYLTAYRKAARFNRKVEASNFAGEMQALMNSPMVQKITQSNVSMGQTLKALYNAEKYLQTGFVVEGMEANKVQTLLSYLMPVFNQTHDIVILHCITGLHALMMLKDYFDDVEHALDILTTGIITHILAVGIQDRFHKAYDTDTFTWMDILSKGSDSQDVHTIKLTYSCHELYKIYRIEGLKEVALNRIG